MGFKIDMSKYFDRVEWDFLIAILKRMGFCDVWCNLIFQCISTSSSSILINGVPSKPFKPSRGLRQGVSPYLFILCMESFSRTLTNSEDLGMISGFKGNKNRPSISRLLFADDCLIFAKATTQQAVNLLKILDDYGSTSGQMINFFKSCIFFTPHIQNSLGKEIVGILKVKKIRLDDKYLGGPLFTNKSKIVCFENLIQNMLAVLESIPSYNMTTFILSKEITKKATGIIRDFWWGKTGVTKGVYMKGWNKLSKSKEKGGNGLKDLDKMNLSLIAKNGWRLFKQPKAVYAKTMKGKYYPNFNPFHATCNENSSWSWKEVYKGLMLIKEHSIWEIGNKTSVDIWKDRWIPNAKGNPITIRDDSNSSNFHLDSDLMIGDSWNIQILHQIFDWNTIERILTIKT